MTLIYSSKVKQFQYCCQAVLFLGIEYADAKTLLSNEIPFAIASDYNPGSSPSGNMNFILSLACNKLKLTTEQAINAATINGAYAMGLSHKTGSITKGKIAMLLLQVKLNQLMIFLFLRR